MAGPDGEHAHALVAAAPTAEVVGAHSDDEGCGVSYGGAAEAERLRRIIDSVVRPERYVVTRDR